MCACVAVLLLLYCQCQCVCEPEICNGICRLDSVDYDSDYDSDSL